MVFGYHYPLTVQPLCGRLNRIARESALQHCKHAGALLTKGVEAGAYDVEIFGIFESAKASRYFLLDLGHTHGVQQFGGAGRSGRGSFGGMSP